MTNSAGTRFKTAGPCPTVGGVSKCPTMTNGVATMNVTADQGGPAGNADAGTVLTLTAPPAGIAQTTTVAAVGISGGRYFATGAMTYWWRWVSVLKNYSLPADPFADTTIFQKPVR